MKLTKMHGCGNDFLLLDGVSAPDVLAVVGARGWNAEVRRLCDRHSGIGADGVIVVQKAGKHADMRMRIFNSDGNEAEMCGNGVRCVAKFAHERLGVKASPMRIESGGRVLQVEVLERAGKVTSATVDMGKPELALKRIGVLEKRLAFRGAGAHRGVESADGVFIGAFVSMGNPHFVVLEPRGGGKRRNLNQADVRRVDLAKVGPPLERHEAFPKGMNVHFAATLSRTRIEMRTWERGAGETRACGTGACAAVVAGVITGRLGRDVRVGVPGGELRIRWDRRSGRVFMTGPAEEVGEVTAVGGAPARHGSAKAAKKTVLRTSRLVLRPFRRADVGAVARQLKSGLVARHTLTIPYPYTKADAEKWIGAMEGTGKPVFAICLKDGTLVGAIDLIMNSPHRKGMLGYWVGEQFWGKGYATEAAEALIEHGFKKPGLERIDAYHYTGNPASGRVMQKAGMRLEGVMPKYVVKNGESQDCVMYGITREMWEARGKRG